MDSIKQALKNAIQRLQKSNFELDGVGSYTTAMYNDKVIAECEDAIADLEVSHINDNVVTFWEDNSKEVLVFEQYVPEHIVVCLGYSGEDFVQVMKVGSNGVITSKVYRPEDKNG